MRDEDRPFNCDHATGLVAVWWNRCRFLGYAMAVFSAPMTVGALIDDARCTRAGGGMVMLCSVTFLVCLHRWNRWAHEP